jgi:hypothetical protein
MFYSVWTYIVGFSVIVGLIGFFLGVIVFLYSMSSRISVVCELPPDSNKPFPAPFEVQNQGYLWIYDVNFSCIVQKTETANGSQAFNLRTRIERPPIPAIRAGEKSTFYCTFFWRENIVYADIAVEVKYRPKFLFWKKEKHFRFVTRKDARGRFVWSPRALSE